MVWSRCELTERSRTVISERQGEASGKHSAGESKIGPTTEVPTQVLTCQGRYLAERLLHECFPLSRRILLRSDFGSSFLWEKLLARVQGFGKSSRKKILGKILPNTKIPDTFCRVAVPTLLCVKSRKKLPRECSHNITLKCSRKCAQRERW